MASGREMLDAYRGRFCFVEESYAVQLPDGHYVRAYRDGRGRQSPLPVENDVLAAHLRGERTLAFYTAKRVGELTLCREGIVECDDVRKIPSPDHPGLIQEQPVNGRELMRDMHLRLERAGIPSALEASRRGARVRVFAQAPVPAREMQKLLLFGLGGEERAALARGERAVEINPKQQVLGPDQVGNSVRGPFGIHRKSGERYPFLLPSGEPAGRSYGEQMRHLMSVPAVDVLRAVARHPWLEQELSVCLGRPQERESARERGETRSPARASERGSRTLPLGRWKDEHSIEDVLARYGVRVPEQGNARCPLPHHANGDRSPSLQINREQNRWYCHTSGLHGSQLDIVIAMEGLGDAREALAFLRGTGEIPTPASRVMGGPSRA